MEVVSGVKDVLRFEISFSNVKISEKICATVLICVTVLECNVFYSTTLTICRLRHLMQGGKLSLVALALAPTGTNIIVINHLERSMQAHQSNLPPPRPNYQTHSA